MAFRGVLAKRTSDLTAQNTTGAYTVSFESEVYDTDGAWSAGAPTDIVVPSAWNGKYGILTTYWHEAAAADLSGSQAYTVLNGAFALRHLAWNPYVTNGNGVSIAECWGHAVHMPVLLTTGDVWTMRLQNSNDGSVDVKAGTSMSLYVLDTFATAAVMAVKSTDQTGADYSTPTAIAWDGADAYDTHGIHASATNNTKLIIPAAMNNMWVIVRCNVCLDNVANANPHRSLAIRKNGSTSHSTFTSFVGASPRISPQINNSTIKQGFGVQTHPFQVSTGDEIEAVLYCSDTSVDLIAARSSFCLWNVATS